MKISVGQSLAYFFRVCPDKSSPLKTQSTKNDPALVDRQAHTLKSTSGNVDAVSLQEAAMHLELAGKNGYLSRATEILNTIKKEFEKVKKAMIT